MASLIMGEASSSGSVIAMAGGSSTVGGQAACRAIVAGALAAILECCELSVLECGDSSPLSLDGLTRSIAALSSLTDSSALAVAGAETASGKRGGTRETLATVGSGGGNASSRGRGKIALRNSSTLAAC